MDVLKEIKIIKSIKLSWNTFLFYFCFSQFTSKAFASMRAEIIECLKKLVSPSHYDLFCVFYLQWLLQSSGYDLSQLGYCVSFNVAEFTPDGFRFPLQYASRGISIPDCRRSLIARLIKNYSTTHGSRDLRGTSRDTWPVHEFIRRLMVLKRNSAKNNVDILITFWEGHLVVILLMEQIKCPCIEW